MQDKGCHSDWIIGRVKTGTLLIVHTIAPTQYDEVRCIRAWERLRSATSYGDCLVTIATSEGLTQV